MTSVQFTLTKRDGSKTMVEHTCKENDLSSLSSSLRTLKTDANVVLSELVAQEKSINPQKAAQKQESSEDEGKYLNNSKVLRMFASLDEEEDDSDNIPPNPKKAKQSA